MPIQVESNLSSLHSSEFVEKPNCCHLTKTRSACVASHKPGTQLIIMPKNNTSSNTLILIHFFHCNYSGAVKDNPEYFLIIEHHQVLKILHIHHSNLCFHLRLVRKKTYRYYKQNCLHNFVKGSERDMAYIFAVCILLLYGGN